MTEPREIDDYEPYRETPRWGGCLSVILLFALLVPVAALRADIVQDTRAVYCAQYTTTRATCLAGSKDATAAFARVKDALATIEKRLTAPPEPQPAPQPVPAPEPAPTPVPVPVPPPAPSPTPLPPPSPTLACKDAGQNGNPNCEPADIQDPFPSANGIEVYGKGLAEQGQLPPTSGDSVGAFRLTCPGTAVGLGLAGVAGTFDPMFYPGQRPAGHLHAFGSNDGITPNSTYLTLRTTGSGCNAPASIALYRSAFWFPAMLDGAGNIVFADYFNNYYKQLPSSSPDCKIRAVACVPLPNGLKFVEGYNMATGQGGPGGYFECWQNDSASQRVPGTSRSSTISALVQQGCKAANNGGKPPLLVFQTGGPECWDGKNIDSADHRSHVAYPNRPVTGLTTDGGNSNYGCPVGWYLIPQVSAREVFTTDANFEAGKWRFSCDDMTATKAAGSCGHFDYWEAQSPVIKALWQKFCIDAHKSCSGGDLGNGQQIKGFVRWPQTWKRHVLAPLSSFGS